MPSNKYPLKVGNNKYEVRINYSTSKGNYKCYHTFINAANKSDAKKISEEIKMRLLLGRSMNLKMSMEELFNAHLESNKNDYAISTIDMYKRHFKNYIGVFFKNRNIYTISAQDCNSFKIWLNSKNFTPKYKNNLLLSLRSILNTGVKVYGLENNPMEKIDSFKDNRIKNEEEDFKYWTLDQFKKWQQAFLENNDGSFYSFGQYTMICILFFAGCRKGEAFALTWNDIVERDGKKFLHIYKCAYVKKSPVVIKTTKNKSSIRYVPIVPPLEKILEEQRERAMRQYGYKDSWYITFAETPLTESALTEFKNRYEKIAKLPHIRMHDLRHSFISFMLENNVNHFAIQKMVGHASAKMINNVYGHMKKEVLFEQLKNVKY